jgi:type II secretory pathway component GspD/PulD (secretin)
MAASVWLPIAFTLMLTLCARSAAAQTQAASDAKPAEPTPDQGTYQTFYLTSVTQQRDANDAVTDLRNMLPRARIYLVDSQNAISMRGSAEDIQAAQKILSDIDRPRKTYRVTYSIIESEGGKNTGTQKIALIVADLGEKTTFKQGSKVPIVTGTTTAGGGGSTSEVQYLDVGLNIEASLEGSPDGVRLRSRVTQSGLAEGASGAGVGDPSIHQTVLEGMSILAPGKPLVLGSLDIPGGTRHEEVEVVSELVR